MPVAAPVKNSRNDLNSFLNANFNLVIVFLVIIVLVASYFFLIKPKFELTLVAIRDNTAQQEQFYQNQRQKLADLQAAANLYRQVSEADIKKVNTILPNEYAKERLFGELEDVLLQQGLILNNIKLTKSGEDVGGEPMAAKDGRVLDIPNADRVGTIRAEVSLSSTDYAALRNLLPVLENHLQLIDIQSLDFSAAAKTVNLVFLTYYFK